MGTSKEGLLLRMCSDLGVASNNQQGAIRQTQSPAPCTSQRLPRTVSGSKGLCRPTRWTSKLTLGPDPSKAFRGGRNLNKHKEDINKYKRENVLDKEIYSVKTLEEQGVHQA